MPTQTGSIDLSGDANAAKVATNYIAVDDTGIRIAQSDPATATTYQHQTATETEFFIDGDSVASFGGTGTRIGSNEGSANVWIDNDTILMQNLDGAPAFEIDMNSGTQTTAVSSGEFRRYLRTMGYASTTNFTITRTVDIAGADSEKTVLSRPFSYGVYLVMNNDISFSIQKATTSGGASAIVPTEMPNMLCIILGNNTATIGNAASFTQTINNVYFGSNGDGILDITYT